MENTGAFLTAEWRYLAMVNYEIDPAILLPRVPSGAELDSWNGKVFISVVGFLFLRTRVVGLPVPFHRNFEEVNLRFYVRRKAKEGWRRGVVFVKEIVPRRAIAVAARTIYGENYVVMPMRHNIDIKTGLVEYWWSHNGRCNSLSVRTVGGPREIIEGSETEFITEHFWGYAAQRDGGCIEYRVEHPRWQVYQVTEPRLECDVERMYGGDFVESLGSGPTSAFLADGSAVVVRRGVRI